MFYAGLLFVGAVAEVARWKEMGLIAQCLSVATIVAAAFVLYIEGMDMFVAYYSAADSPWTGRDKLCVVIRISLCVTLALHTIVAMSVPNQRADQPLHQRPSKIGGSDQLGLND